MFLDVSKVYAHHMVRTDSKAQKLDAFLQRRPSEAGSQVSRHEADMETNSGDTSRDAGDIATASPGVHARFVVIINTIAPSYYASQTLSLQHLYIACVH